MAEVLEKLTPLLPSQILPSSLSPSTWSMPIASVGPRGLYAQNAQHQVFLDHIEFACLHEAGGKPDWQKTSVNKRAWPVRETEKIALDRA